MYAGVGRAGDFAGNPLKTVASHYIYWLDAGKMSIRAVFTLASLPANTVITYRNGEVQARAVSSPQTFTALVAGSVPNLAAVAVASAAYDASYDPLGGLDVANLTELRVVTFNRLRGLYRVSNPAIELYELYKGEGGLPDFTAAPWQTFTSLPFTTPALTNGVDTYLVLRKRNRYDLQSKNVESTIFVLDAGGSLTIHPTAPREVRLEQAADGAVRVRAWYDWPADSADARADAWAVWITTDGSDPDPSDPATYEEDMNLNDADAKLDYTTDPIANGTTVKALVRTRRSGVSGADSVNIEIYTVTADALAPAAPSNGQAFLGQSMRTV